MKSLSFSILALLVCLALLVPLAPVTSAAQERPTVDPNQPECPLPAAGPPGARQSPEGPWYMPEGSSSPAGALPAAPEATGGPDDFGYRWDDSVPLNWIDASGGTETGIDFDTDHAGPIGIGFSFKYYENTYTQLYISRFGFLAFSGSNIYNSQSRIPSPEKPNDVIAPHWVPAYDVNGYVRYLNGGTAPNRWFVVEWNRLESDCCGDAAEEYTFEVILHENGDIVFQYGTMTVTGGYYCQASGIEDSTGIDGLAVTDFCERVAPNHAVRFYRPAPSARIRVWPLHQGAFTRAGETKVFEVPVRNTGDLGPDTFDLFPSSSWPLSLYQADGVTPLTDTDGDSVVDTGPVAQGTTVPFVAKVETPGAAVLGDDNTAAITIRSSLDTNTSRPATLRTAVPAPFAQVFGDDADAAMSLELVQPVGQVVRKATPDGNYGFYMSVAETASGFVHLWLRGRPEGNVYVYEIEYTLWDHYGTVVRPVGRLTNHGGATLATYDYDPAVAVAPNGRIGVLWYRYLYNYSTSAGNYNMYYAILDASGHVVVPPTNLTNNPLWGSG